MLCLQLVDCMYHKLFYINMFRDMYLNLNHCTYYSLNMITIIIINKNIRFIKICNIHKLRSFSKTPENKLYIIIHFNLSNNSVTKLHFYFKFL